MPLPSPLSPELCFFLARMLKFKVENGNPSGWWLQPLGHPRRQWDPAAGAMLGAWGRWVWLPQPPTTAVSSPVGFFSLFQFAPHPFLHRGSRSIFLPVSVGRLPMQIDVTYLLKKQRGNCP